MDARALLRAEDGQPPQGDESAAPASEGVLVLRSGGVLAGRISRKGERYVVVGSNSELSVPVNNVVMVCQSLTEAYQQKREQLGHPTADEHLELAEWCLRHGLTSEAEIELAAVRKRDPQHPKLPLLERRLAVVGRSKQVSKGQGAGSREQGERSGEELTNVVTKPAESDAAKPPQEEMQRQHTADDLLDGALERFTRKVQPLLVNNCTTSGCHQIGGEQQFQLDRALLHGQANRRSTQFNLAATLALVDRDTPQLSPLLTIPRQAHGGIEQPLVGPREEQQFEQLVDWVALVTQSAPPKKESLAEGKGPAASAYKGPSGVVPASVEKPIPRIAPKPRVQYGASGRRRGPRDPFDPEIFNAQSLKQ